MRYKVAEDARPQIYLLLVATIVSIGLWFLSAYLPLVGLVTYPIRIFTTFLHEGSHVLAAVLTGSSVQSLSVAYDGSGVVWSEASGWFSQLFISSAGYLGTTAFCAALLVWMRYGMSSRIALYVSAGFVALMTVIFGILSPMWNFLANVTLGSVAFTVIAGAILSVALLAIGKFATIKWANFAVAFLAVQCLANAVFDLVNLFFISASTNAHSDAANMAAATGIPSIVWVFIWMGISIAMISIGLRVYAVSRARAANSTDSVFED
ncbi:MAG TPA: M50 family metallopeptidase [Pyrinomonadaceae bacterium]|nr:M50 family metallopeptidase [Pyrinomonadaceae bacterium]